MENTKQKCENCKNYHHSPNILGGIATCNLDVKYMNTFWSNDACEKFEPTVKDNLKEQKDFYKMHLGDTLDIKKS